MKGTGFGMGLIRYGLPAVISLAGIVAFIIGDGRGTISGAGVVLIGSGLMVWMINWMYRMTIESNGDRDVEDDARDYYLRHGHWPGEGEDGE